MNTQEIPLSATPQRFRITLAGVAYGLTVKWNSLAQAWFLDIADANNAPLASGLPFVTGADLVAQLDYLGIVGKLVVASDDNFDAPPTFDNLGTNSHLYFIT